MAENCPEVLVGAGTIVNVEQAKLAVEMGAKYKADGTLNAIYLADEICGSSPATTSVLSTTYEKSELIPHGERVWITYFYQRHYILSLCPPVLPVAEPGALYIRVGDYYIPDLTLPEEIRPSRSSARHP